MDAQQILPLCYMDLSLGLLLHTSLISTWIWGADSSTEYFFSKIVLEHHIWNPNYTNDVNSMLSIVILAPVYSILSGMDLHWVFKTVYPLLFSLVPLGLFKIFKNMTGNKTAFLACFFFMSIGTFFTTMVAINRQEVAEIFLVLLIMLMVNEKFKNYPKTIMLLFFSFGLVVSHYGLAYILILLMILAFALKLLMKYTLLNRYAPFKIEKLENRDYTLLNNVYPLFLIVFAFAWFLYVSSSSSFHDVFAIFQQIFSSITDVLNPSSSQGTLVLTKTMAILLSIERYLFIISIFFISVEY